MPLPTRARFLGTAAGAMAAAAAGPPSSAWAAGPATVRIGYIESMSGPFADVAERQYAGVRAALAAANRRGGTRFEVVLADDTTRPAEGVIAARRLIEQEKVDALMIGTLS